MDAKTVSPLVPLPKYSAELWQATQFASRSRMTVASRFFGLDMIFNLWRLWLEWGLWCGSY